MKDSLGRGFRALQLERATVGKHLQTCTCLFMTKRGEYRGERWGMRGCRSIKKFSRFLLGLESLEERGGEGLAAARRGGVSHWRNGTEVATLPFDISVLPHEIFITRISCTSAECDRKDRAAAASDYIGR